MAEKVQHHIKTAEVKWKNSASKTRAIVYSQSMSSPIDQVLYLQRNIGNQAVQRLIKSGALQAKLKIGQPGDKYEQEADRVADQLLAMPENEEEEERLYPKPLANQITPLVQKQEEPPEEEEESVQAKSKPGESPAITQSLESRINSLKGGYQPLDSATLSFFERRLGVDLGDVRVHEGVRAVRFARSIDASAFTLGRDIVLGTNSYSPATRSGRQLMAHEAAHAAQQLPDSRFGNTHIPTTSTARLEREGDKAAQAINSGREIRIKYAAPPGKLQFFRMGRGQKRQYPKTARFVQYELPKDVNDAFLMKAINEAARNTGRKARSIKQDFKWNSGPLILIKRQRTQGAYTPGTSILKISKRKIAKVYEKNPTEPNEMALETTILHEYVHYLGSGREKRKEEWGAEFEEKLYGVSSPSFKYFNRTWFGFGQWEVKVIGKNSRLRQRLTIKDADKGNGTYPGRRGAPLVRVTKNVKRKPYHWRIIIEHKVLRGWSVSRIRKNQYWQGIIDNNLIRSEDGTDRNFNDFVLQVRRINRKL